ncbi:MAG: hypothetical protein CVV12_05025 [Gammaproteobacteria bacterium HGW-Gammaproteobacteria-2]|jgi:hypothetical protein|nr:MAG: hypothetical protein CVV12_05025 [Gammaproteobacteria bacterium HGW-Gammaproteobacteria-2]
MAHSQSDAQVIWDYLCERMRIVMRGSPRRWAVLSLVALLHLLLAMMLAHIMRKVEPEQTGRAIQVQFVDLIDLPPPPLPDLPPTRRRSMVEASAAPPDVRYDDLPAPVTEAQPEPAPKLRLFRPDGSVNVAEDLLAKIERRVLADGLAEYRIADLDKAGYFETRTVLEYEETVFERYWVPGESLLEEWVRRGIHEVSIPIPGSNQKITCYISLVAPGAACGITSPKQMTSKEEREYEPPPNRNLRTE